MDDSTTSLDASPRGHHPPGTSSSAPTTPFLDRVSNSLPLTVHYFLLADQPSSGELITGFERYQGLATATGRGKVRRMRTGPRFVIGMVCVLGASGCVRRDGHNSDCRWPGETSNHSVSARHLSADGEFAEDLAIRYADVHFGLRTPNPSDIFWDDCC
jgi:hypothetical protein